MAEQPPAIQNKKQLLIGAILAVLVVVIYNYHIRSVREAGKGRMIQLVQFKSDMFPGQKLDPRDLQIVEVSDRLIGSLGSVVKVGPKESIGDVVRGYTLAQNVQQGWLLQAAHLGLGERRSASDQTPKGMVAVPLLLDPKLSHGDMLNVGDRVTVLGIFQLGEKPSQWYPIVKGVKVLSVGGRGPKNVDLAPGSHVRDSGMRSYRTIVIQVPVGLSTKLRNVFSHVQGTVAIDLISAKDAPTDDKAITITPELRHLAEPDAKPRS